jgi:opacity protein-like surface antigen
MCSFGALAAALVVLAPAVASAGDDVDLIPAGVVDAKPAAEPDPSTSRDRSTLQARLFVEDAFSLWSPVARVAVPYPKALAIDWQNRTSLDVSLRWQPWASWSFALSDRGNVFEQDGQKIVSANTVRNDLREASIAWEPVANSYLEGGRINVRSGSALGFNPTDFFKTRTLVGQASLDPSIIRQNRLGTLMVRAQTIWSGGSASIAYAPKLAEPSPINPGDPVGVDPHFDATNAAHRVLCTLNLDVLDLSPQVLGYFELHRSKIGANLSRTVGSAVVVYAEWAGGPEQDLVTRAIEFGRATGTLPRGSPVLLPTAATTAFRNDVAAGLSWAIASAITVNAEYHFHEAGFDRRIWRDWFAMGSAPQAPPAAANELWYVRGYASDQQEPVTQQQSFVRVSWPRAFVPDLELTGFAFVSLLDASVLTQLSVNYYVSDAWTASVYVSANVGDSRSERGSSPQRGNAIVQLTRYL